MQGTKKILPNIRAIKKFYLINWNNYFIDKDATQKIEKEEVQQKLIALTTETKRIDVSNDRAILKRG